MGKTQQRRSLVAVKKATDAVERSNAVEKLQRLRAFVSCSSGEGVNDDHSSFSETDLTNCLKKCGYNVEMAAEMLITGQYKEAAGKSGQRNSFGMTMSSSKPKLASGNVFSNQITKSSVKTPAKQSSFPKKRSVTAVTPGASAKQCGTSSKVIDLNDNDDGQNNCTMQPTMTSRFESEDNVERSINSGSTGEWLLCNRWLSDAVCTAKNGRVSYCENLEVTASLSKKSKAMLSFRGNAVEGRLAENLATMLAPLLLMKHDHRSSTNKSDTATKHQNASSRPIVQLRCHALMSEEGLRTGSHIPVSLSVLLVQPQRFFQLFDTECTELSPSNQFLERRKITRRTDSFKGNITQSAFNLLQWAEYGDVPEFKKQDTINNPLSSKDRGSSGHDKINEEDEEVQELDEEDFEEAASVTSTDQGKELAKSVASGDEEWASKLPEAKDPPGFSDDVQLRPYQKQALYWMRQREVHGETREQMEEQLRLLSDLASWQQAQKKQHGAALEQVSDTSTQQEIVCDRGPVRLLTEKARKATQTLDGMTNPLSHPLWKTRYLASSDKQKSLCFFVNELLGLATHTAPKPPTPCSGGILADAMGLGKTVMLMALILQRKAESSENVLNGGEEPSTTLVVAKLSLLLQWEEEIRSKTNLSHLVYYGGSGGTKRNKPSIEELNSVDVVITTYGTIQGELSRKNAILTKMRWLRVILDEAHCVKNPQTLASKICCILEAKHRWCVSGTIIQNSLDDIYGIMKFLHHEPWCLSSFWKTAISKPLLVMGSEAQQEDKGYHTQSTHGKDGMSLVLDRVRRVLAPLMLRRTKDSLMKDGKPILTLPPIESKIIHVELTAPEREFYDAILARSTELFDGFVDSGVAAKSYFQIFSLLVRLRQACDHILLTVRNRIEDEEDIASLQINDDTDKEAPRTPVPGARDKTDVLGSNFLEGLYSKFISSPSGQENKRPSSNWEMETSSSKRSKVSTYVSSVANALSVAVRENLTHLQEECPICLENPEIENAILAPCGHGFCRTCLIGFLNEKDAQAKKKKTFAAIQCPNGKCPICDQEIEASKIIAMTKTAEGTYETTFLTSAPSKPSALARQETPKVKPEIRNTQEGNVSASARLILQDSIEAGGDSSKMMAVMKELDLIWQMDPGSKIIIFSQFLGFLDLMEQRFEKENIAFFRLDGKLSLNKRMDVLDQFRSQVIPCSSSSSIAKNNVHRGSVLLMSMGAGGEGLNLVAASSVFIVDPWWNMAKEDQCVNRIHRIGQIAKQVRVRKFAVKNTVEERIVELQNRKKQVADEVYNDAGRSGGTGAARLSMEDFKLIFRK